MTSTAMNFRPTARSLRGLTDDDIYDVLRSERRRLALRALDERSPLIDLGNVAEEIAAREVDTDHLDEETVTRVEISLHHIHLPKMDELGVLEYDRDSQQVIQAP